jgi:hypothetical protein
MTGLSQAYDRLIKGLLNGLSLLPTTKVVLAGWAMKIAGIAEIARDRT